jgi:predicted nucleotidyltransferase
VIPERVVETLRGLARRLREEHGAIVSVRLFGSFAFGRPTPRSDADVAIVVSSATERERARALAEQVFLEAPVPVELFVFVQSELEPGAHAESGIAAAAVRSITLA